VLGAIVPFRSAAQRQADATWVAVEEQIRRRMCADCETLREESERIRAGYVERQARIEKLLQHYQRQWDRA
jgi:hypothetical protein